MKRARIHYLHLSFICLLIFVSGFFLFDWLKFFYNPLLSTQSILYEVKPGTSIRQLAWELHRRNLINRPRYLILLATDLGWSTKLKTGEYQIPLGATPKDILQQIVDGKVYYRSFKIIEGWTFNQIRAALQANPYLKQELTNVSDAQIMQCLQLKGDRPEGQFFPDTYHFAKGMSDLQILKNAANLMQQKLTALWQTRPANFSLSSPYEVLIAASIVEKETAVATEKPLVAGIIYNRLQKNMRLQMDPTVIYGLAENYQGKLLRKDLLKDTPYNTYTRRGLPPTPICMPSEASLKAVMLPAKTDYLYFVAKGDGSHVFSISLVEQTQAINRYLR